MVARRLLAALLALGVTLLPSAAQAREPGPTWHSETDGVPVSTMQGHWTVSDDGRSLELVFAGGHLIQAGTTFEATWLTPFSSEGQRPRFESSYEMENLNQLGEDIELVHSFRFRSKGERWFPWITFKTKLRPGFNSAGGGSSFSGGPRRPAQVEWKLTGTITAPTYLRGSAVFSIN